MSEHVPPTDWVREAAADKYANRVSRPAFNRWLAAHDAQVRAEQREVDLAMHHAYRPEVVAEVAVYLGEEADWDGIATWCGGEIVSLGADMTGEYQSAIRLPDGRLAHERTWIVQRHDLTFDLRVEVEGPSAQSVETLTGVRAEAERTLLQKIAANPPAGWSAFGSHDVDELAGVIADHRMLPALGGTATGAWVDCSCGERITGWTRDHAQAQADRHLARAVIAHLTKGTNDE